MTLSVVKLVKLLLYLLLLLLYCLAFGAVLGQLFLYSIDVDLITQEILELT